MAAYEANGESDEWYTPKYIFDALGEEFDLDVAAPSCGPRYVPAEAWISSESLYKNWHGFIWMNPPFGHQRQKREWLSKFFRHGNGIALIPDRTSAPWWQEFASLADAILFVTPKIKFEREDGSIGESPGTGTCLFAKGERAVAALERSGLGLVVHKRAALAPAAVVMPPYADLDDHPVADIEYQRGVGWNMAIAKVARLNRRAIPVELLKSLSKSACKLINEVREFNVSGVYFTEIGENLQTLTSLELENDELRALLGNDMDG